LIGFIHICIFVDVMRS